MEKKKKKVFSDGKQKMSDQEKKIQNQLNQEREYLLHEGNYRQTYLREVVMGNKIGQGITTVLIEISNGINKLNENLSAYMELTQSNLEDNEVIEEDNEDTVEEEDEDEDDEEDTEEDEDNEDEKEKTIPDKPKKPKKNNDEFDLLEGLRRG